MANVLTKYYKKKDLTLNFYIFFIEILIFIKKCRLMHSVALNFIYGFFSKFLCPACTLVLYYSKNLKKCLQYNNCLNF